MTWTLFNFSSVDATTPWQAIDDRVMGGASRSQLYFNEGHAVFEGNVSDRNNGGFASVRAQLQAIVPNALTRLWIETRGDDVSCYINLRMNNNFDGVSYRASFAVTPQWKRVEIPFTEFLAVLRGRSVNNAPDWTSADIRQVGLMVAGQQLGPFKIDIRAIGVF